MEQGRTTDSGATQAPTWLSRLPVPAARQVALAVALAAIVGVALALRLYGVDWDRGYSYTPHPDERAILMKVGELRPPGLGELGLLFDPDLSPWNPRWFPYGSFPLYLLKAVQLGYSEFTGSGLHDLRTAGRVISTLADVAAVVLVYLLGSRMYGRREGLLASALVALTVLHIPAQPLLRCRYHPGAVHSRGPVFPVSGGRRGQRSGTPCSRGPSLVLVWLRRSALGRSI